MKREILFRGKAKRWKYGSLLCLSEECVYIVTSDIEGRFVRVDPDTVGQYIGVLDKNGTKIFEGDVILFRNPSRYGDPPMMFVVEWDDEMCEFRIRNRERKTLAIGGDLSNCYAVIGNIYDNPDLIGGGEC